MTIRRTALVAVLLFAVACGGGDDFEPAPGASLELDELERLITAALSDFDLRATSFQALPLDDNSGGYRSCFVVESGPCYVPRPPGMSGAFQDDDGTSVLVNVLLAVDEVEASDLVKNALLARTTASTGALRVQYEGAPVPESRAFGPCDSAADREADDGCAWQERGAPGVGDEAKATKSEILEDSGLSMVAFARAGILASVEILSKGDSPAPNALADEIARALDEQIKQALSQ